MVKHIWKMIWNQRGSNGWDIPGTAAGVRGALGDDGLDVG